MLVGNGKNLSYTARDISSVSQTNRYLYDLSSDLLDKLHQKHKQYRRQYLESKYTRWNFINRCSTGILIDAFCTELNVPFARSSYSFINDEMISDIKEMVEIYSEAIHCDKGELRCRYSVTPIVFACINEKIPVDIIDLLLSHGADPWTKVNVCGNDVDILNDITGISEALCRGSECCGPGFKYNEEENNCS